MDYPNWALGMTQNFVEKRPILRDFMGKKNFFGDEKLAGKIQRTKKLLRDKILNYQKSKSRENTKLRREKYKIISYAKQISS